MAVRVKREGERAGGRWGGGGGGKKGEILIFMVVKELS